MKKTIFTRIIFGIVSFVMVFAILVLFTGCEDRQADRVSYNISQEADNFNVTRRLVVINGRTDKPFFELIGNFSFSLDNTSGTKRIICIVETERGVYKKHSVGLPDEAFWNVEDISGADVSRFHYEVNFLPEMILPITFVSED